MEFREITVLGAGIIGISTAMYLQKEGFRVTLLDEGEPGGGCSFGNCGLIQCSSVVPVASPGILKQVPKMLLDPDQPLVMRWQYLPSMLPYLLRFIASARPDRVEHIAKSLASIIPQAYEAYRPLIADAKAEKLIQHTGELHVYESETSYAKAQFAHATRRAHGVDVQDLTPEEIHKMEPNLAPIFPRGVYLPQAYATTNPHYFSTALFNAFMAAGGAFRRGRIQRVKAESGARVKVHTDNGMFATDAAVVALGAFSKPIAKQLGSYVPLNSERGYHLMLPDPQLSLRGSIVSGDYKFAICPMDTAVRLLGTAELAKVGAPPRLARANRLLPLAKKMLPALNGEGATSWMGHRPSTPDSLPVIGRSPHHSNVFFAFGHNHSGLTLGGITGQLIADLVCGRSPRIDISPFDIARFRRWRVRQ